MNIFDVIGPVMVGPSSSHTAGAVRIGFVARQLLGEEVREAKILLYGSFLQQARDMVRIKALVAGLLGRNRMITEFHRCIDIAEDKGMKLSFGEAVLKEAASEYGTALFKRCFRQDAGAYRTVTWRRSD